MNKVLKKVLIYLAVGVLGAMVGIGALIGVSSCAYKQDNNTQVKAKVQPKGKLLTGDLSQILGNNNIYYFVAKHYDSSGAGVFWRKLGPSHTIDNANYSSGMPFPDISTSDLTSDLTFTVLSDDVINSDMSVLRFWLNNYNGSNILVGVTYYNENFSRSVDLFGLGETDGSYFNRNHAGFSCTQLHASNSGVLTLISFLFNVYELGNQVFTFDNQINYYAPYAQDISSNYVADSTMSTSSSYVVKTILDNVPFYTGGLVFDTIRLRYMNAIADSFYNDNGERYVMSENYSATYMWTEYVNTVTNYVLITNERLYQPYYENNVSGYVNLKGSKWVSTYYQKVQFFDNINNVQITELSKLNNSSYISGITQVSNSSIGLGSVFTLLSQAFTAWTPIFAIQIVPGITIGLLLFLPLIAGVIVLIIWVVKR